MKPIYKLFYLAYRGSSGLWYWARRRFTLAGLCIAGGFAVAGSVGVDIENTVTYQSFSLLAAFLLQALATGLFFRARFSVARSLPRLGTAGQPLSYLVTVKNLSARTQSGLTLLEKVADPRPNFEDWLAFQLAESRRVRPFRVAQRRRKNPFRIATVKEAEVPPLPPNGEAEVRVEIFPLRRGVLQFTGAVLARSDPLGLFRAFSKVAAPQTALILPRRYPLPPVALPGAMRYQEGGVALAANVGRSDEFVALREYRRGDPLRHIHWRSWAKTGKPIVKEFEDEFFVRHALVLDTFDGEPNSEMLEEAVSVAASFACTVLTQESLLDLLFAEMGRRAETIRAKAARARRAAAGAGRRAARRTQTGRRPAARRTGEFSRPRNRENRGTTGAIEMKHRTLNIEHRTSNYSNVRAELFQRSMFGVRCSMFVSP